MLESWLPIVWPEVWVSFGSPPARLPVPAPVKSRGAPVGVAAVIDNGLAANGLAANGLPRTA